MGFVIFVAQEICYKVLVPEIATGVAMEQFANPSLAADSASRAMGVVDLFPLLWFAFFAFCVYCYKKELAGMFKKLMLLGFVVLAIGSTGCVAPYHEKMLVDVGTSEVAFLIETVNDGGQASIAPKDKGVNITEGGEQVDFYRTRMVNARKIEIPYYWKQTARRYVPFNTSTNGAWKPAARLITVNTAPQTRSWHKETNQPIWVESNDSVGFSTGISITARIEDQAAAIEFLSHYPPKSKRTIETAGGDPFEVEVTSLEQIMDEEMKTKIQEVFAYEAAAFTMDELREKKREIFDEIRTQVVPYFEERGITITSIGQFGGFEYENPKIQEAIDNVFQAQQDEEVAKAEAKAAEQRKVALKLKGEGEAAQILESKKGEAEAIKLVADAKAYELQQLQSDPDAYLRLKTLEIQEKALEKWGGVLPRFMIGEGKGVETLILDMNQVDQDQK